MLMPHRDGCHVSYTALEENPHYLEHSQKMVSGRSVMCRNIIPIIADVNLLRADMSL